MPVTKIRHVGVVTNNLDQALHFYKKLLGFKEVKRETLRGNYVENLFNVKGIELTYVKLKLRGTRTLLEIWYFPQIKMRGQKNSHIALTVENLDYMIKKLKEEYIEFLSPPLENKKGKVKVCFCTDFDGNLVELVEEKE